jgi:ribosomal protein S18 acetylase RimI-like enzyme
MEIEQRALTIRKLAYEDLHELEWDGEYTHFRRLYFHAYQQQNKGAAILWVAEHSGFGIIGQAFVQLIGSRPELSDGRHRAYIYSVRVRTPFQNVGIGSQMMQSAEDNLFQQGFSFATLNVSKENPDAQRFYERIGYRVVAHEPGRWSYINHEGKRIQVHEPSWRMEKKLK